MWWLLVGVPLAILAGGIWVIVLGRRGQAGGRTVRQEWVRTSGVIESLREHYPQSVHHQTSDQPWYSPVVRFQLPDGRQVQAESQTGSRPAPGRVGEAIPLYYDPKDPRKVQVDAGLATPGRAGNWFVVLGWLMIAISLVFLGFMALLKLVLKVPL